MPFGQRKKLVERKQEKKKRKKMAKDGVSCCGSSAEIVAGSVVSRDAFLRLCHFLYCASACVCVMKLRVLVEIRVTIG